MNIAKCLISYFNLFIYSSQNLYLLTLDKQICTKNTNLSINDFSDNLDPTTVQEVSLENTHVMDSIVNESIKQFVNQSNEQGETIYDDFDFVNFQNVIQEVKQGNQKSKLIIQDKNLHNVNTQNVTQEDIEEVTQEHIEKLVQECSQGKVQGKNLYDHINSDLASIQDDKQRNVFSINHGFTPITSEENTQVTKVGKHLKQTHNESHAHSVSKVNSYPSHAKDNKRKNNGSKALDQSQNNKRHKGFNSKCASCSNISCDHYIFAIKLYSMDLALIEIEFIMKNGLIQVREKMIQF